MKPADLKIIQNVIETSHYWTLEDKKNIADRIEFILKQNEDLKANEEIIKDQIKNLESSILKISDDSKNLNLFEKKDQNSLIEISSSGMKKVKSNQKNIKKIKTSIQKYANQSKNKSKG